MRKAWNKKYPNYWTCLMCNKRFANTSGHVRKYCSLKCRNESYRGKQTPTTFKPGKDHWNYCGNPISRDATRFNYPMMREIANRCNYVCQMCGFVFPSKPIYLIRSIMSFDHIRPIRLGGRHSIDNGQLLCRSCNKKKTHNDRVKILHSSTII